VRLFGLTITRGPPAAPVEQKDLSPYSGLGGTGGWFPVVREWVTGAWQRNDELKIDVGLSHPTLFRCASLISSDIAKMCLDLVEEATDGIWTPTSSTSFSPVLTKPNRYQNRIQFIAQWVISKLLHGNTYVLKERDNRNVVVAIYILDPMRCRPMVAPDGSVFYNLSRDTLSGVTDAQVAVPASEIIHDRWNTYVPPAGRPVADLRLRPRGDAGNRRSSATPRGSSRTGRAPAAC
jgi:phage portal protein BeeE